MERVPPLCGPGVYPRERIHADQRRRRINARWRFRHARLGPVEVAEAVVLITRVIGLSNPLEAEALGEEEGIVLEDAVRGERIRRGVVHMPLGRVELKAAVRQVVRRHGVEVRAQEKVL